jgi:hypothetical protein
MDNDKFRYLYISCVQKKRAQIGGIPTDREVALDDWIILVEAYMQIQAAADE